jgi:hypothetical protein
MAGMTFTIGYTVSAWMYVQNFGLGWLFGMTPAQY